MSKYCANCGDRTPQGAGVCDNCGMPVSETALPQQAPAQQATVQSPPPLPPAEESTPLWQPEQDEPLATSQVTLPGSARDEDRNGAEQRRGAPRWVTRAAGFVGTAVAALAGMMVFWRRGIDALERKPDADSATQQDMGVAPVQDPVPGDQVEAKPDSIGELVSDDAATGPGGPEPTLDPSLTDPDAPGPALDPGLIDEVEKIPNLVAILNRNPELVDAINEDPEFIELCKRYPEFIELCERYPDFLYLCYHYPQFIELCYQYPHFIHLCYEYPHFIDICYEHPQFIYVCRQYPEFFEKHPEIVDTMEDNPDLVDLMEQKPALIDALEQRPDMVEKIDENPSIIDAIERDPALIGRMQRDPAVLEELATTTAETHTSSGATPPPTKASQAQESATIDTSKSTLAPELLDPTASGPTLDTGLVERIEQNPELVEAVNRDEDVARALERDPASVDQIERDLGLADEQGPAEPSGVTEQPAGTVEPEIPEPGPVDQDLDDQPAP